jgi:hypothetical protein
MKMVKRMLIAIAVVALVATSAPALDVHDIGSPSNEGSPKIKQDDSWPTEYIALAICEIPVLMDVGMYVQIKDCHKIDEIKLVQVKCDSIGQEDFPCYSDCTKFKVRANFAAQMGTKLTKADPSPIKDWKAYYKDDNSTVPGDGEYHELEVCVDAWKTEIWTASPGDEVPVGTLTITVKPQ